MENTAEPHPATEASNDRPHESNDGGAADKTEPQENEEEEEANLWCGLCGLCFGCCLCVVLCPVLCCCAATNEAVNLTQKAQGKRWDATQKRWIIDNIEQEQKTLLDVPVDDEDILKVLKEGESSNESDRPTPDGSSVVKETKYYDVLAVPTNAEPSQLKRAYYLQARKWHPDRNPSDQAKAQFQLIGEAYQVLSDPQLRAVYDREGEEGLSGDRTEVATTHLDPSLIFTFLFGNDSFRDIVGRLHVVTQILTAESSPSTTIGTKQLQELERRRVLRLALSLLERIDLYMEGDVDGAKATWTSKGEQLVNVRYGEEILNTVGRTYRLVATQLIGNWSEGMDAKVEANDMKWDAMMKTLEAAGSLHENNHEEEAALPAMITMMWNTTVIDITSTLREVVLKVCKDVSVDTNVRRKRAEAIRELGSIWESQQSSSVDEMQKSARSLFASATAAAMKATLHKARKKEQEQ